MQEPDSMSNRAMRKYKRSGTARIAYHSGCTASLFIIVCLRPLQCSSALLHTVL